MNRIAVLIDEGFEDSEYSEPAKAFKEAGHELVHIGLKKGAKIQGKGKKVSVKTDLSLDEGSVDQFEALFIPGGYSPDHLRADPRAVKFAADFMKTDKPVFAICHGPQILINAQALHGRKLTGWKSIAPDIRNAGGEYLDEEVVEDGNLITSRKPADIPAFIEASLHYLAHTAHI